MNTKLSYAIAAILGGSAGTLAYAAPATDTTTVDVATDSLQEVVVTAQRRTENLQDVPISIQALTGETLAQLNVQTIDDFVKYLPNVTMPGGGPGQGNIYMRGLSSGTLNPQSSGTIGTFPNVAIYLDDQSGQLPGRNLDIYAADLQRIEILEGPQGTLFGAGAQAGVVRYITNKPKLDVTEGNVDARLQRDRSRRQQQQRQRDDQYSADQRYPGVSGRDLRRQSGRLHRQRARHFHAQETPISASTTRDMRRPARSASRPPPAPAQPARRRPTASRPAARP